MPEVRPVPAVQILRNGAPFDNALMDDVLDVEVRDSLLLPATAVVRFVDTTGDLVTNLRFGLGDALEVKFGKSDKDVLSTAFKGEIVAIEPEFHERELRLSIRAYDKGWRLNRSRKSRTFANVTAGDMIQTVTREAGLRSGMVEGGTTVYTFFQQSMETDWEFCWRLARLQNCEFVVDGETYHFLPRRRNAAAATLNWGDELLVFKPRVSGVGQVDKVSVASHDPKTRQPVDGQALTPEIPHRSRLVDGRRGSLGPLSIGSVVVADRVAETTSEATALAQSTLDRLASSFVEAEGKAYGNPALRAGATVKVGKVGAFDGEYVLSQSTHRFTGGGATYTTSFAIAGRTSHSLRDLLRGDDRPDWASSLVIGIVTNNNDPDGLGRVRVKFAALSKDPVIESGWARVVTPSAGKGHGMFSMPQVNDEVVVAFEHGDTRRPLILGALFNGQDRPLPELIDATGGRENKALFGVKTDHQAYLESAQQMTLKSHEKMTVEIASDAQGGTGDFTLDAKGDVKQTAAKTFEVEAGTNVTITGNGSITVRAKGGLKLTGATVDIEAQAAVNVKGAVINLG